MKQQPDKLFRDKLSGYERQAPAMAWDKIESQLDKKNNKALWLRVAASVLALAIAAPVVYTLLNDYTHSSRNISLDDPKTQIEEKHIEQSTTSIQKAPVLKETPGVKNEKTQAFSNKNKSNLQQGVKKTVHTAESEATNSDDVDKMQEPVFQESEIPVDAIADVSGTTHTLNNESDAIVKDESITLIISADESTNYYEGQEENLSKEEATSAEKKSSTFQKLLRKASDLRTNQDPFGELRQKKNEILALNFKSDKKRSQKQN